MGLSPISSSFNPQSGALVRARLVLPMTGPPIPGGAVLIRGKRIAEVGPWRDLAPLSSKKPIDLGDALILPGLVNAHCHLDYTNMAGLLPPPRRFTDWLQSIVSVKAHWSLADYRQSWQEGARMLARTGTTTVADIEAFPELLPEAWETTPLRVVSFLEMIGLSGRRDPRAIVSDAASRISALPRGRCQAGLSPHAPYSTVPTLLRFSAQLARRRRWLLCTHVAESAQEFEMFTKAEGELFTWLKRSGRDMSDCGTRSPVRHMDQCGALGPNVVAVHANYLRRGDAALLARRGVSVVHCPRSHVYFGHGPFPLRRLQRAGVNLCLGTDSLATVFKQRRVQVELSMFAEMRALAAQSDAPDPKTILQMATVRGAKALHLAGKVGGLTPGGFADLIALPFSGKPSRAAEAAIAHEGKLRAGMIDGKWHIPFS